MGISDKHIASVIHQHAGLGLLRLTQAQAQAQT